MDRPTLLVVEDDPAIRRGLVDALTYSGYTVIECERGDQAAALAVECSADLVLLDVMLPGCDGFEVLDAIRENHPTLPVIMLTARGAEDDRVRGLANGADDYVVKPFGPRELLARVEAVLRRSPQRAGDVRSMTLDGRRIDLERREVADNIDPPRQLTDREALILHFLAAHAERAVDRKELLQHVWGLNPKGLQTRTVDMHIARLRDKIEADPAVPGFVVTVRGKGYMLGDGVSLDDA